MFGRQCFVFPLLLLTLCVPTILLAKTIRLTKSSIELKACCCAPLQETEALLMEMLTDYARGATVGAVAGSIAGAGGLSGMVVGTVAGWTGGMIYNSAKNVVYYYYTQWSANQLAACIHATGGSKQSCCATTHFIKQCYDDVQEIEALFPISTHSKPLTEKVPSLRL
ncbi:hypothetical protein GPALN_010118 [Globodera pallida]|nr:hypothetical protein GPALN_010118 [Globodera pallida]